MDIGKRIKELRLAHGLTQDELALRAGLTKGFISLLERNKSSVSLEALSEVVTVLGESLSDFFLPDAEKRFVFGRQDRVTVENQQIDRFELLVPGSTTMAMEPCLLVLAPQERLGPQEPHNGEELGYVVKGRVSILLGALSCIAKAGDCFSYKARQQHSILNVGHLPAQVLLITWPPQF